MQSYTDIMQKLDSKDKEVVREAAFACGDCKYYEAIPKLAELLKSSHMGIQEAAELTLRKLGGKESIQGIIPLLWSEEAHIRNVALEILRDIGNQDLDSILQLLDSENSDIRIFAADILGCLNSIMAVRPLCNTLTLDPEANVRYQAAISLGELGNSGAVGCLKQALDDQEWVQFAVIEALQKIKDESCIKALTNTLGKSSELIDSVIIEALGDMNDLKVTPYLLKIVDTSNIPLRNKIVKALVNLLGSRILSVLSQEELERFYNYLLIALEDEDEDIQAAAIEGLQYIGEEDASEAVFNLLLKLEEGKDDERIEKIIQNLRSMQFSKALQDAVYREEETAAQRAIQVLIGFNDPEVKKMLANVFWQKNRDLQREISQALSNKGDEEVKDFFWDVLNKHTDGTVLKNALVFFGHRMQAEEATDKMLQFLDHRFDDVKETALEACLALDSEKVKSKFKDMLNSNLEIHRLMGIYALGEFKDPTYIQDIRSALDDELPDVRKIALESISKLELEKSRILEDIISKLQDENKEVRLTAVKTLGEFNSYPEVKPCLLKSLQDKDDWVVIRSLEALIKNDHFSEFDKILNLLDHSSQLVRIKTIETLGSLGDTNALPNLLDLLNDENPDIQNAAEEALSNLREK